MKQITNSSFNEGLVSDLNPLTTPQTCLSDCVNGTIITFNGNEFTLQSDNGNVKIEGSEIKKGYIPVGAKEYGGILYLALLDPATGNCEIGSIPSPDFDTTPKDAESGTTITFKASPGNYSHIIKLFEQNQLIINPGDLYRLTETGTKPQLYKYHYKAFDTNENIYNLNNPNVSNTFKPFDQTLSATLGLEITLDNITYFDAYVVIDNEKLKINYFAENKLQGIGTSDDIYIESIQYKIFNSSGVLLTQQKILIDERTSNISGVHEFDINSSWGNEFIVQVIPESNYEQLTSLTKSLNINLETFPTITEGNTLFKYNYSKTNKNLRLEFDYQHIPKEDTQICVEFYDIWSDFSVSYFVENPNPFGKNILFIDTTNEKLLKYRDGLDVSENGTIGGVDSSEIITKNVSDLIPSLSTKFRNKQVLREDNLYICAIHKIEGGEIKNTIKKPFVLNDFLNESFSQDDVKDMTNLGNRQIDVNNSLSIKIDYTDPAKKTKTVNNLTLFTDKNNNKFYYKLSDLNLSGTNPGTYTEEYETSTLLDIKNNITSIQRSYGIIELTNLTENILLDPSSSVSGTDDGYELLMNKLDSKFEYKLKANRKIQCEIGSESRELTFHDVTKDIYLADKVKVGHSLDLAGIQLMPYPDRNRMGKIMDLLTGQIIADYTSSGDSIDDWQINDFGENIMGKRFSGFTAIFNPNLYNSNWRNKAKENMNDVLSGDKLNYFLIMYCDRKSDKYNYLIINYTSKQDIINILTNVFTPTSIENKNIFLNYYTNLKDFGTYETSANGKIKSTISATPEVIQYYKKDGHFKKSNYAEIMTDLGISYVDQYLNMDTSNFDSVFFSTLPILSITASVDSTTKNRILSGLSDLERQESQSLISSELKIGTVYSKNRTWDKIASKFIWENENSRFKLVNGNWSVEESELGIRGSGNDEDCIDYAGNYFLNSF